MTIPMQQSLEVGQVAPSFSLPSQRADRVSLADFRGKRLILYFYPKDNTSGCTKQAVALSEAYDDLQRAGFEVLGISRDSVTRHTDFADRYHIPFHLLSDEDGEVCERYGVWVEKKNYGRTYMGIERSTFIIDDQGCLIQIWRKVRAGDHLDNLRSLLGF